MEPKPFISRYAGRISRRSVTSMLIHEATGYQKSIPRQSARLHYWIGGWRPVPGLCSDRLLAYRTIEPLFRASWNHLHFLLHRGGGVHLGRRRQLVGKFVHCSIRSRSWDRLQILNGARLRGRVFPSPDPRSARHDVADVDCVRYHAG